MKPGTDRNQSACPARTSRAGETIGPLLAIVLGMLFAQGCRSSRAPTAPEVVGPVRAEPGDALVFSAASVDPRGDILSYLFCWGDTSAVEWSPFYPSGATVTRTHRFLEMGRCTVTVRSRNTGLLESRWSEPHELVIGPLCSRARTYGGGGRDELWSVEADADGGFVMAGFTESYGSGGRDAWLVKTDASGREIWSRTYGGPGDEWLTSVRQTSDHGYILAGYVESFGAGGSDAWLIRTDASGDSLWTRTYGGEEPDAAAAALQTQDGGYVMVGYTGSCGVVDSDAWMVKTDAAGGEVWRRAFGSEGDDWVWSVEQTPDGGYILAGGSAPPTANRYCWAVKTDAFGHTVWTRVFAGDGGTWIWSARPTTDGGYILLAGAEPVPGNAEIWLIKADALGDTVWSRTYGDDDRDWARDVRQTADGGFIVAGDTRSGVTGEYDVWLIKTDPRGDTAWTRRFGGDKDEFGMGVRQTPDGGYVVVGHTQSYGAGAADGLFLRTDDDGE